MKQKRTLSFKKFSFLYSIYQGTSDELMFFFLIDTVFLTIEKGLTAGEISLMMTVSYFVILGLRYPCYALIRRIGNANSLIVAALMFFSSALCFTFGNTLFVLCLGRVFYSAAPLLQDVSSVILKENLEKMGKENEYVRVFSRANVVYSSVTLISALTVSFLFELNHYLPLILSIVFCIDSLIIVLVISRGSTASVKRLPVLPGRKVTVFSGSVLKCIVLLSFNTALLCVSGSNMKLLVQERLSESMSERQVVLILGAVVVVARIARLLANMIMQKADPSKKDRALRILTAALTASFICAAAGSLLPSLPGALLAGTALIASQIFFDPLRVTVTYHMLGGTSGSSSQMIISVAGFAKDLLLAVASGIVTLILTRFDLYAVTLFLLCLAFTLFLLILLWKNKLAHSASPFGFFGLDSCVSEKGSLPCAAAFLLRHYGRANGKTGENLIEYAKSRMKNPESREYDFSAMKAQYDSSHPCAVLTASSQWLPVIYMDGEDALLANISEKRTVFLSEIGDAAKFCSFSLGEKSKLYKKLKG